jgi:hypothetical protein
MTTGPGDRWSLAQGGHGRMRASHDDREQVITALKAAFVHGRLTQDELAARTGQALAATTWAGLAALTADLPGAGPAAPAVPAAAPLAARPARSRRRARTRKAAVLAVTTVPPFATIAAAILLNSDPLGKVAIVTFMVYLMVWTAAGLQAVSNRLDKRAQRSLPPPAAPPPAAPPPAAPRELAPGEPPAPYRGPLDGLILSEQRPPRPLRPYPV